MVNETKCSTLPIHNGTCYMQVSITNTQQYLLQAALEWWMRPSAQHYQYTTVPVTGSSGMVNETKCSTLPIHDSTCYRQLSITNTQLYLLHVALEWWMRPIAQHYQYMTVPVTGSSGMVKDQVLNITNTWHYLLHAGLHYQYTTVPVTGSSPLPTHDSTCYRQLSITNTRQYLLQATLWWWMRPSAQHYQYTTTCYRQLSITNTWQYLLQAGLHYQYMTVPVTGSSGMVNETKCSTLPIHDSTCYRQLSITNTWQYLLQAALHYQYMTVPVTGSSGMVNETKCSTLPIHDSTCYRQLWNGEWDQVLNITNIRQYLLQAGLEWWMRPLSITNTWQYLYRQLWNLMETIYDLSFRPFDKQVI